MSSAGLLHYLVPQVMPQHRDADIVLENVSPMLEVLFEELFFVAILLLIWYINPGNPVAGLLLLERVRSFLIWEVLNMWLRMSLASL